MQTYCCCSVITVSLNQKFLRGGNAESQPALPSWEHAVSPLIISRRTWHADLPCRSAGGNPEGLCLMKARQHAAFPEHMADSSDIAKIHERTPLARPADHPG